MFIQKVQRMIKIILIHLKGQYTKFYNHEPCLYSFIHILSNALMFILVMFIFILGINNLYDLNVFKNGSSSTSHRNYVILRFIDFFKSTVTYKKSPDANIAKMKIFIKLSIFIKTLFVWNLMLWKLHYEELLTYLKPWLTFLLKTFV